ncbi:glyoxalase [Lentzea sp. NBRC 105346]|uniref:VOC family protein n=1 Tax=Lentzea sp. NBRC 105346 TaxID=3032205 RepID=UPI0024A5B156|nr:VOC family protein [Lentzea sp. NBRC 105346]GLZ31208.1 glyoxalase [Lentzea sp. NBRC 105346]
MPLTIGMITIDTTDTRKLADFWTAALRTSVARDYEGEYLILEPTAKGAVQVAIQRVPDPVPGKNRLHLDLLAEDREAEVARLLELGATEVATHTMGDFTWNVLADPDGNQFCIAAAES